MMTMTGSGVYVVIMSWMSRSHCAACNKVSAFAPLLARAAWSAGERASRILGPVLYQPTTASLAASPGRDGRSAGRTSQKAGRSARTVDAPAHAIHLLVVGVVQEPDGGVAVVFLERH